MKISGGIWKVSLNGLILFEINDKVNLSSWIIYNVSINIVRNIK